MHDLFEQLWSTNPYSSQTSSDALNAYRSGTPGDEIVGDDDQDEDTESGGSSNEDRYCPFNAELCHQLDSYTQNAQRQAPTAQINGAARVAREQLREAGIDPSRITVPMAVFEPTEWSTTAPGSWHANIVARMINDRTYGLTPGAQVRVDHAQMPFQSGRFHVSNYENRDLRDFAADITADCFDQYTRYISDANNRNLRVLTLSSGVHSIGLVYEECLREAADQIVCNPENREQFVRDTLGNRADRYFEYRRRQNAAFDRRVEEFRRENAPDENANQQQREEFERRVLAFRREQRDRTEGSSSDDEKSMVAALRRGLDAHLGLARRDRPMPSPDGVGVVPEAQLRRIRDAVQRFEDSTRVAADNGMVIVIATGNSGSEYYNILARSPHVIAVGAADVRTSPDNPRVGHVARFSSTGNSNYRNLPFESPTVVAPGSGVPLEFQVNVFGVPRPQSSVDGTSVAAPFVGGTVGLMLSQNPDLTFTQVRDLLRQNSRALPVASVAERAVGMLAPQSPLGSVLQDMVLLNGDAPQRAQGAGLLNVRGAVEAARDSRRR